jgi:hypothetical protein
MIHLKSRDDEPDRLYAGASGFIKTAREDPFPFMGQIERTAPFYLSCLEVLCF